MTSPSYRVLIGAIVASVTIATAVAANAGGVTYIQQADGSSRTYRDVSVRLSGQTLWLRSADHKGTLKVVNGACSFADGLQRCLPYSVTLYQGGAAREIGLSHGTVSLNLSSETGHLPHSSEVVAPQHIVAFLYTQRGTYISLKGKLDEVAP